ncbi:FAD-binding oxidoreductase [Bacillus sp. S/N-304-OC-R1]|uniref:FAD-binding oxidoreductase n=1 Tax=Bacillus sp. S/N-304-OC-R1 TaxID=2758034 RepID=UPI001C8EC1A5|nr:FAD-binding oxidoreductase [Bacillus sp. S/N-304-OC-R1]MBY0121388.1 FAD-binding oxidoreductase [Bacillus sp. S/N-304-OC-R1]
MNSAIWVNELTDVLSKEQIYNEENDHHILGNSGLTIVYPYSEEDISTVLKFANKNSLSVSIMGNGSKRGFGGLQEVHDLLLSLGKYKGVIEHTVGDMTVTVKAGTPFQELQDYLAKTNQKISLDPFLPAEATVGGILAANDSGPKRLKYGSARDSVIGIRTVYPDGTVIRSGGKVVKNVAGYDMNKLFIGSMGTLGVMTEVTFKLRPLPKYESLVFVTFPDGNEANLKDFSTRVLDSVLEPVCIELLSPSLAEKLLDVKKYTIVIAFEDVESSVHYQEEMVKSIRPSNAEMGILNQSEAQHFWKEFYSFYPDKSSVGRELTAVLKIGVVNLDVIKVIKETESLQDLYGVTIEAHGGLGHGVCHMTLKGGQEDIISSIQHIRKSLDPLGGYAVGKHLPYLLRMEVNTWGEKPAYFSLLEGIKSKIDPNKILNPKRFVGGI